MVDSKQNASHDQQRFVYTRFMWGECELNAYHCSLQKFVVMLFLSELSECCELLAQINIHVRYMIIML